MTGNWGPSASVRAFAAPARTPYFPSTAGSALPLPGAPPSPVPARLPYHRRCAAVSREHRGPQPKLKAPHHTLAPHHLVADPATHHCLSGISGQHLFLVPFISNLTFMPGVVAIVHFARFAHALLRTYGAVGLSLLPIQTLAKLPVVPASYLLLSLVLHYLHWAATSGRCRLGPRAWAKPWFLPLAFYDVLLSSRARAPFCMPVHAAPAPAPASHPARCLHRRLRAHFQGRRLRAPPSYWLRHLADHAVTRHG